MSEEATKHTTQTPKSFRNTEAHEQCQKAKDALEKANTLLAESGNQQDPDTHNQGEDQS